MPTMKALREEIALAKANINAAREQIAYYKQMIVSAKTALATERRFNKVVQEDQKALRQAKKEAKKAERIAKMEAKLAAMKNPVGIKAVKANRKPSAVTVTEMVAA